MPTVPTSPARRCKCLRTHRSLQRKHRGPPTQFQSRVAPYANNAKSPLIRGPCSPAGTIVVPSGVSITTLTPCGYNNSYPPRSLSTVNMAKFRHPQRVVKATTPHRVSLAPPCTEDTRTDMYSPSLQPPTVFRPVCLQELGAAVVAHLLLRIAALLAELSSRSSSRMFTKKGGYRFTYLKVVFTGRTTVRSKELRWKVRLRRHRYAG